MSIAHLNDVVYETAAVDNEWRSFNNVHYSVTQHLVASDHAVVSLTCNVLLSVTKSIA